MELNCVVIDDEPQAVELLKNYIARTPFLKFCAGYTDSVEAASQIIKNPPDILFLDIQMPDLDGLELSKMVLKQTKIIFTTAFKQYAFESYDVSAADYLLKPSSYAKFLKSTQKCLEWFEMKVSAETSAPKNSGNDIFVKSDGMMVRVNLSELLYVCGLKDYVKFVFRPPIKPVISLMTMKNLEEMLLPYGFLRVNRSYIVATDKIKSVDKNDCICIGDEIIHVTDIYKDEFYKHLF
ncbi:MAG: response regulator transcription factor [Bacteroidales bacterium]|nr:response regulator transcription factor [Bacteroidales bacterium]